MSSRVTLGRLQKLQTVSLKGVNGRSKCRWEILSISLEDLTEANKIANGAKSESSPTLNMESGSNTVEIMENAKNLAGENVEETLGEAAADENWVLAGQMMNGVGFMEPSLEMDGEDEGIEKTFDDLRKDVQKIIDEKLMENEWTNSKPVKIKLEELSVRDYLHKSIIPIMTQAFETLAKERPPEPIEFLATYLIKNKKQYQKY